MSVVVFAIKTPVFSAEFDSSDDWDSLTTNYNDTQMKNPVTEQEYNNALNTLQNFKAKKDKKAQKNRFVPQAMRDRANEIDNKNKKENSIPMEYPENKLTLLRLPSDFVYSDSVISSGYYLVAFSQKNNKYYLQLFQSSLKIADIEIFPIAYTSYKQEVKIEKYNDNFASLFLENDIAKFKTYLKYKR